MFFGTREVRKTITVRTVASLDIRMLSNWMLKLYSWKLSLSREEHPPNLLVCQLIMYQNFAFGVIF